MSTALRRSGNQPKRCRRDIAGNVEIPGLGNLLAENANAAVVFGCRSHKKIVEHLLHVISGRHWFFNGGLAFRKETGQKQRAFHLCTSCRWAVLNSTKRAAMDAQWRRTVGTFGNNARAHLAK